VLLGPSIPARIERNVLINPTHKDAASITHDLPLPIWRDDRLYG
jgi:RES domain-containing protein